MSSSVQRATRILVALAIALSVAVVGAGNSQAAQGRQGLQGGWAVNDSGQIQFFHSLSTQYPYMSQAGAGWVRVNFRLGQCFMDWISTGCNGSTALATYDNVIANAVSNHLTVLGLLSNESWPGSQTDWTANNAETTGGTGDNSYIQAFAQKAAGVLADHYNGTNGALISQWEVWNEPNAWTYNPAPGVYEGSSFIYPSNFAWLLKRTYAAIKTAQPQATVISGGLFGHDPGGTAVTLTIPNGSTQVVVKQGTVRKAPSPTSTPCTSSVPSGADYLCSTYAMGIAHADWTAGRYPLDSVGQHLYIDQGTSTSASKLATYLQDVRNAYLSQEGQTTQKKTQVTEVGWSTALVSPRVQAQNLQIAFQTFKTTSYVARSYWFSIQDVPEASLYYGLVTSNATHKPSFGAYQRYAAF